MTYQANDFFFVTEKQIMSGDDSCSDEDAVVSTGRSSCSSDEDLHGGEKRKTTRKKNKEKPTRGRKRSIPSEETSVEVEVTSTTQGK